MARRIGLVWLLLGAAAIAAGGLLLSFERRAISADLRAPRDLHETNHVGSTACRRCHQAHYASWGRTFHRTMTREATLENVRGDFSGATLSHAGVEARMDRDGHGAYRMTFTTPGASPRTAKIVRTVGSRRYQQYLAEGPAGPGDALWRLPVAYHIEERRWFPMTAAFLFSDSTETSSSGRPIYGGGVFDRHVTRWNDNCVFCHNVAPNPGLDAASGAFDSTVAELGIACESCHGPGGEHVRRNADPVRRYALHLGRGADPTIINPARLSPGRSADVCGRCHGQRIADEVGPFLTHGDPFVAGDELALYSSPLWQDTPLHGDRSAFAARFWNDGTPRLTAYEYQGLLQSACAIRGGLTCTTCHGMHEGDPRGQLRARFGEAPNAMCTGCHSGLTTDASVGTHARHDPAGAGASCVACHMPRIVYGVLDIHRSHRIDIPKAANSRPNACTLCHLSPPSSPPSPSTSSSSSSSPITTIFSGDPVTRAVAADAFGRAPLSSPTERASRLGVLLDVMASDRYPAVRHIAWRSLRRLASKAVAVDYDPSAELHARRASTARLQADLRAIPAPPAAATLRGQAHDQDLEIGE